ncbi:MAG: Rid family hydrolase, partial [Vicinamibacterales bacterium]
MRDTLTPVLVPGAPKPVGPYSSAVVVGSLIFVSGQSGRDPKTDLVSEDIEVQTEVCLKNVEIILKAAGSSLTRVVR